MKHCESEVKSLPLPHALPTTKFMLCVEEFNWSSLEIYAQVEDGKCLTAHSCIGLCVSLNMLQKRAEVFV